MSDAGTHRQPQRSIEETEAFMADIAALADIKVWDDLAIGLYWHIDNDPDAFPLVDDPSTLRVAQTKDFMRDGVSIPALQIWFRISDDNSKIIILGATPAEDDIFW